MRRGSADISMSFDESLKVTDAQIVILLPLADVKRLFWKCLQAIIKSDNLRWTYVLNGVSLNGEKLS